MGMDRMIEVYHDLPKAKGVKNITIPGELEWALVQDRRKNGIPLDEIVMKSLNDLSDEFKVDFDLI
jgi:LDH2 family malate/lactate/ureidoglycolate dehydrogenase